MATKKISEKGFSLLELLLVVGVGALLLLGGLGVYRLVTQGNKTNEAIRLLSTIKNQTQLTFQNQALYEGEGATGDMVQILVAAGAIPSSAVNTTTGAGASSTVYDPWGRAMTIETAGTPDGSQFAIGMTGISDDACVALGTVFNTDNDSDFVSLEVGTTSLTEQTVSALTGECDGDNNNMTWTFF